MTKKDYELIASGINAARSTWTTDTEARRTAVFALKDAAITLSDKLQAENNKFDRVRFMEACGFTDSDYLLKLAD